VAAITAAGGSAAADTNDISSFAGAAAAVQTGVEAFGKVDIVINNAGVPGGAPIEEVDDELLARHLAVHFHAALGTSKAAWPMMKAQHWGRIVNTVSEEAFPRLDATDGELGLVYGPAKAAVWSATFGLAAQGRALGITVNAISPGAFTRMNRDLFESAPTTLDLDPVYVARVAAWLASDEADEVTGRVVHVAGGHHREYVMARHADTELVQALGRAVKA